jgi:Sulfotransferase domain
MNNLWEVQTRERVGVGVRTTEFYERHNERIRAIVPKERLFEFRVRDGWVPLCWFLGKDMPVGEFPHGMMRRQRTSCCRVSGVWCWGVGRSFGIFVGGFLGWSAGRPEYGAHPVLPSVLALRVSVD